MRATHSHSLELGDSLGRARIVNLAASENPKRIQAGSLKRDALGDIHENREAFHPVKLVPQY